MLNNSGIVNLFLNPQIFELNIFKVGLSEILGFYFVLPQLAYIFYLVVNVLQY